VSMPLPRRAVAPRARHGGRRVRHVPRATRLPPAARRPGFRRRAADRRERGAAEAGRVLGRLGQLELPELKARRRLAEVV
jgi:hypothetical protein